ncbi:MAG: hypothetical protein KKA07_18835 [Bacteroidetes bacterium]|nr:hypothetical protein [Bacteroidota bacterium]MBU1721129.1 hypothetical protein [Bacteroidota bacterium]
MILFLIKSGSVLKAASVLVTSAIKFVFAPALAFKMGYTFMQTVLITTIGGVLGVVFFFYFSKIVIRIWEKYLGNSVRKFFGIKKRQKAKKVFTKRNRFIIKTTQKYGLVGMSVLTPVLFSIPLGTFLTTRFFSHRKNTLLYLTFSVICWAFVMSSIFVLLRKQS